MPNGAPTGQLQALSQVVTQVGFPVVVAGFLLWFVLTKFMTAVDSITDRMSANATAITQLVASENANLEESKKQTALMQQILAGRQVAPSGN